MAAFIPGPSAYACEERLDNVLGDLSESEVSQIQAVVDDLNQFLMVVGSAADGKRRNLGKDLPFGKGNFRKSDIDYMFPIASASSYGTAMRFINFDNRALVKTLPERDAFHFILVNVPDVQKNRILFSPHQPPIMLEPGTPNPSSPYFGNIPVRESDKEFEPQIKLKTLPEIFMLYLRKLFES